MNLAHGEGNGKMLWGVPKPDDSPNTNNFFANVEAVLGCYHPDMVVPPYRYIHSKMKMYDYDGPLKGQLSDESHKFLRGIFNTQIGIFCRITYGRTLQDIKDLIDLGVPSIVTIDHICIHSVIVVGYGRDDIFFLNPLHSEDEPTWGEETLGHCKVFLGEFEKIWNREILEIWNQPFETFRYPDALLIRHLRERHHGFQGPGMIM